MSRTRSHLLAHLDPASTARLTQPCADEADFNSLTSALADVLGRVVPPGTATPLQRRALEALGRYAATILQQEAWAHVAAQATGALDVLREEIHAALAC